MNDLLEFYENEAQSTSLKATWFADRKTRALESFRSRSFPTRQDEDWKYTRLDGFLEQRFSIHSATLPGASAFDSAWSIEKRAALGMPILLYNGQVLLPEGIKEALAQGAIVAPILEALELHEDKIRPWLGKLLAAEHGFHALNIAALQTGLFIYIPAHVQLEAPLVMHHWQDQAGAALYSHNLVILGESSSATLVENYEGKPSLSYCTNTITEIHVAALAQLKHYKIQNESKSAYHFGHIAVQQDLGSHYENHSLNLGAKLARSDLTLTFLAKDAHCLLNGIYLPTDGQHVDHHTSIHHSVPDCTSVQNYKGVLTGKSQAVFNGKILVGKRAVRTLASQENKNLLLSNLSQVNTKPQLEIFADDVRCKHGATVGRLDEEALFYMLSRGITRDEATSLLIQAFAADNLEHASHPNLRVWLAQLIEAQWRKSI